MANDRRSTKSPRGAKSRRTTQLAGKKVSRRQLFRALFDRIALVYSWGWVKALVATTMLVLARFVYQYLERFLPFKDEETIKRIYGARRATFISSTKSNTHFVVSLSDARMFSFQYCLDVLGGKPRGDAPKLIFYRKARLQGLFDFLDTVLRLPSRPRYEKVHDITLNPPDGWPIVLIDDVRFVGPNKEALAVIVGTDSCGSLGAKYLGVFVLTGEAISFVGPGPWKAIHLDRVPPYTRVLTSREPLQGSLSRGLTFALYSIEDAIFFSDIDGDGQDELVQAFMLWSRGRVSLVPASVDCWSP